MTKNTVRLKIITLSVIFASGAAYAGVNLGVKGETWPIAEQDLRVRMAEDAAKVDWKKINQEMVKDAKGFVDRQAKWDVPPATTDSVKLVDISQELTKDLMGYEAQPDGSLKEKVIFKKGYRFNPLERMAFPRWFAVFSGESKEQVEWAKELERKEPGRFVFMAVDGKISEIIKSSDMAIYPTNPWLFATAGVQRTPAIVGVAESNKTLLTVAEFAPPYSIERTKGAMK